MPSSNDFCPRQKKPGTVRLVRSAVGDLPGSHIRTNTRAVGGEIAHSGTISRRDETAQPSTIIGPQNSLLLVC